MPFKNPHPLYVTWQQMRARCNNPNNPSFHLYGGRGIKICKRWDSFPAFIEDMGDKPDGFTLDRIDNDGDYEPTNCRWASRKEQSRNTNACRTVNIDGRTYRAVDLAEIAGRSTSAIVARASRGLSYSEVVSSEDQVDHDKKIAALTKNASKAWRKRREQTHCKRGHEFTPGNTAFNKKGSRVCKTCRRDWKRARRAHTSP